MQTLDPLTFPLDGNRMIEASAGTGKTHAITNLYLRALLGHGTSDTHYDVRNVLVLTFTIAATEELRGRIRLRILQAARDFEAGASDDAFIATLLESVPTDGARIRLLAAAKLLDEAAILTIHGFCARVTRDLAFDTGTLFDRQLILDGSTLRLAAATDFYREEMVRLSDDEAEVVLTAYRSPQQLLNEIATLLPREVVLSPAAPSDPGDISQLKQLIDHIKGVWISENISKLVLESGLNRNRKAMKAPYHVAMKDFALSARTTIADRNLDWWTFAKSTLEGAVRKNGKAPEHPIFEAIELVAQGLDQFSAAVLANFRRRAIERIRERLAEEKARASTLTFDDLLISLRDALRADATRGGALARRLATQYPLAIVDEFQDTDDAQYEIFSRIYRNSSASLIVIGDPKQAIYKFRGADIFTYIDTKRGLGDEGTRLYSLAINWRATPGMVGAVNRMFSGDGLFRHRDIPYPGVTAAPVEHLELTIDGTPAPAMTLYSLSGSGRTIPRNRARLLCSEWAAEAIAVLLNAGKDGTAMIGEAPVTSGRIAVLARDRHDAGAMRDALGARGIKSVYVTQESVLLSSAARDLLAILIAILSPANERYLRTALATPLMNASAREIDALGTDVRAHQELNLEFSEYHRLWAGAGIASMINAMIARRGLAARWLRHPDGERQMTNLRHLAELLQQRASEAPGLHRLVKWYAREIETATTVAPEERQLRLESDHDLVQIITMHSAKGLEYDIVFVPMAAFGMQERTAIYHEERTEDGTTRHRTVVDLQNSADGLDRTQDEQLAEDIRLLYVAITRAKYKCYVGIADTDRPRVRDSAIGAALGYTGGKLADHLDVRFGDFEHIRIDDLDISRTQYVGGTSMVTRRAARAPRNAASTWRVHSYTGLSRQIDSVLEDSIDTTPGFADDDVSAPAPEPADELTRYSFPRGPRPGIMLHLLLESAGTGTPLDTACEQMLARFGLGEAWQTPLEDWMTEVLRTPLGRAGTALANLQPDASGGAPRSAHELEFHFPLATANAARITEVCAEYGYLTDSRLSAGPLQGAMTGTIDLVFGHAGLFFFADYKSNHLGDSPEAYGRDALATAIREHHYDLQYLVYTVALDRHLRRTVDGYSYEACFGGAAYLFLRGMHADVTDSGVFWDKPPQALIERLDVLLAGGAAS